MHSVWENSSERDTQRRFNSISSKSCLRIKLLLLLAAVTTWFIVWLAHRKVRTEMIANIFLCVCGWIYHVVYWCVIQNCPSDIWNLKKMWKSRLKMRNIIVNMSPAKRPPFCCSAEIICFDECLRSSHITFICRLKCPEEFAEKRYTASF